MQKLEIKPATAEDIEEILVLDCLCFMGIWTRDAYLREIESPNSSLLLLWLTEARSQPNLIGMGCLWSIVEEAHITLLGVIPQYQRRGLGMLLLHSLLKDALQRNLERATLEVKVTNEPALNLYEKFGFEVAGKRKNYYTKTGEDAFILWLNGLKKTEFKDRLEEKFQLISDRLSQQYLI